jgi:archaeal type IV pilus assembly protein PilA
MNFLGQRERSWRKSRKRGVSPIIATILLVAITVVLAAVLYVLISGLTHGPGSTPIGSAFTAGSATPGQCTAAQHTAGICAATNNYIYTVAIASSTVTFSSVLFEVLQTSGSAVSATGDGFSVLAANGTVVAHSGALTTLAMTTTLTYPVTYVTATTSLSTLYTIIIDMGTANPSNLGYTFVVHGTGSFSGATNPVSLP